MDGLLLLLQQGTAKIVEQLRSRLETSLQKLQADELDEATKEEVSIGTCRVQMWPMKLSNCFVSSWPTRLRA